MRTEREQVDRSDELAAIEEALRKLRDKAKRLGSPTGAYLIEMAADEIRATRFSIQSC